MYLSKLEISGFKSFAHRLKFQFTDGVSAIVGPNGCGKTNVVDAIRWVLGEQKTSVLRSDVMENVIFNGTSQRKPLSMAEVTLTLQNNKMVLPTEYSEVTLTRRLFRNGDSHYYLNKSRCRLRDIVDLFMDTGMGSDSYSVIELKMVEAILSGKPEERRHLIEEAAGVNKYKVRRKEASRKLESVQVDLVRVNDILQEVQKNVASLSRQASKTRRYNKLLEELNLVEVELIKHEYFGIRKEYLSIQETINELNEKRTAVEKQIADLDEELNKLNSQRSALEKEYRNARDNEGRIVSEISQKNQDLAVSREKLANLIGRQETLIRELDEADSSIRKLNASLESIKLRLKNSSTEREKTRNDFIAKSGKRDEYGKVLKGIRENTTFSREEMLTIQGNINQLKDAARRIESRKSGLENKIRETDKEESEVLEKINEHDSELENAQKEKKSLEKALSLAAKNLKSAQELQSRLENESSSLKEKIISMSAELSQKNASLEFLLSLVESDETSKFLFEEKEWQSGSEMMPLAEAVNIDEKFLIALNTALGEAGKYIIVPTRKDAIAGAAMLNEHKKGRATFICRDSIAPFPGFNSKDLPKGAHGWITEIIRAEDDLRNALRALLGKTAIVENDDLALKLIKDGTADAAVTLDGRYFSRLGLVRGGSTSQKEMEFIGKQDKMAGLKKDIGKIHSALAEAEKNLVHVTSSLDNLNISELNEEYKRSDAGLTNCINNISKIEMQKELSQKKLVMIQEGNQRYQDEINEIEDESGRFNSELENLAEQLTQAEEDHRVNQSELENAESYFAELQENVRLAELADVQLAAELSNIENEAAGIEKQIENLKTSQANKREDIKLNKEAIALLQKKIENFAAELESLQVLETEAMNLCEITNASIMNLQEQFDTITGESHTIRKNFDRINESLHNADLEYNEKKSQLKSLQFRAMELHKIEIENLEFTPAEDFSLVDARAQARDLRDKLSSLGSVNFLALEEFERESQRLEFYEKQVNDLVNSEKTLKETISEINITAEKKFMDTFEDIRTNFTMLFKKLFGNEGEGDIRLADDRPLESDIIIMAKPPGKRPNSIEQISSGEKTLTAIALLFAIYLVKPSPFCILDEVDAPLDDANIDRYISLIKDFSKDTQFLIVTHNKRTMESADTLYGITMEEEGVSKVVSVRLSPELFQ